MKIQLNTSEKTIIIEDNVKLSELVKCLEKLLPKGSPLGYWKDFVLHSNTIIYNWSYPVYINYDNIPNQWWAGTSFTVAEPANSVLNLEVSN